MEVGGDPNPPPPTTDQLPFVDPMAIGVISMQVAEEVFEEGEIEGEASKAMKESAVKVQFLESDRSTWATLFKKELDGKVSVDLKFCTTNYDNGIAKCPVEILEKGEKEWNEYIVGFFMGRRLPYPVVKAALAQLWKLKGSYDIATDDDFFYFKFTNEEDKRFVMEKGPIFIAGRIFIVKPWQSSIENQRKQIKSIPIWVTVHDLPKKLWTRDGLSFVGSLLGNPICADEVTTKKTRLSFARICVEVENVANLPTNTKVDIGEEEPVTIQFEYPWKPQQCTKCGEFGHTDKRCGEIKEVKIKRQPWQPKKQINEGKEEWKVVGRRKPEDANDIATTKSDGPVVRCTITQLEEKINNNKTVLLNRFNVLQTDDEEPNDNLVDVLNSKMDGVLSNDTQKMILSMEKKTIMVEENNQQIEDFVPMSAHGDFHVNTSCKEGLSFSELVHFCVTDCDGVLVTNVLGADLCSASNATLESVLHSLNQKAGCEGVIIEDPSWGKLFQFTGDFGKEIATLLFELGLEIEFIKIHRPKTHLKQKFNL